MGVHEGSPNPTRHQGWADGVDLLVRTADAYGQRRLFTLDEP